MRQKAAVDRRNSRKTKTLHVLKPASKSAITPPVDRHSNTQGGRLGKQMLSESQVNNAMAECLPYLLSLVPKAIKVYSDALSSDDSRLKISVATKLLAGVGLFESRSNERFVEIAAAAEQREKETKLIVAGMLTEMMLKKAELYKFELPPDLEWLEPEIKRVQQLIVNKTGGLAARNSADPEETPPGRR